MTDQDVNAAKNELRDAFDHMIGELQAARDIIDSPDHFADATAALAEALMASQHPGGNKGNKQRQGQVEA